MKIKTKLRLAAICLISVSVAVALLLFFTDIKVDESLRKGEVARQIVKGASELNLMTYDYLLSPGERPLRQWQLKHSSVSKLIATGGFGEDKERVLIEKRISQNHEAIRALFNQIVTEYEKLGNPGRSRTRSVSYHEVSERLGSQLIAKTQMILNDASLLRNKSDLEIALTKRKASIYVIVSVVLMIIIVALTSTHLSTSIGRSLSKLEEGTQVIAGGDLDHKVDIKSKDETAKLGMAFNEMTDRLKTTYASIEDLKRAEQAVQEAREYAESIIATVREPLVVLDAGLRVVSANRSFHQTFRVKQEETDGRLIYELGNRQWDIPRLRVLLEAILPKNTSFDDFEVDHDFPAIGRRIMLLSGRRLHRETNRTEMILLAIEDITEHRRTEEALRESEARRRAAEAVEAERHRLYNVLETLPVMICLLTPDYHVAFANRSFREKFGESGGRHCYAYCFGLTAPCDFCQTYNVLKTGNPHHWEVTTPDGNTIIDSYDFPFTDADGSSLILEMDIDITAWRQAEEALRKALDQVQFFASQCIIAQERERKLIAGEIHDSMGASLAATKFKVEGILNEMGDGNPHARVALESVIPIIQGTIEEARRIQMALRPSIIDDLGILATVNWFCRQYESTYPDIHIQKEINIEEAEVPQSLKIVIYRVLQEAMNNIAKHSKASGVLLDLRKADKVIHLVIQDSGRGFDLEDAYSRKGTTQGFGLDSMRERTELSGGTFSIESRKEAGTVIRASWPLNSSSFL